VLAIGRRRQYGHCDRGLSPEVRLRLYFTTAGLYLLADYEQTKFIHQRERDWGRGLIG
jgi:hypothetical protein